MTDREENSDRTFIDPINEKNQDHTVVDFIDEDPTPPLKDDNSHPIGYLIIKNGNYRGRVFQLVEKTTVGRKEGNIIVRDPQMSRRHACITRDQDRFYIEDLNTINGTFLNGAAVSEKKYLEQDDVLLIGETAFEFKYLG